MRYQIEWHSKDKDGYTKAEKYATVGYPDEPDIMRGSEHILQWFHQLSATRRPGFSGPAPLNFGDIRAWSDLTGTITRPDEIEAILAMDSAYLEAVSELKDSDNG